MDENKKDKKDKKGVEVTSPLKKKPVVEVLVEEKDVVFASEMAAHCGDQC